MLKNDRSASLLLTDSGVKLNGDRVPSKINSRPPTNQSTAIRDEDDVLDGRLDYIERADEDRLGNNVEPIF